RRYQLCTLNHAFQRQQYFLSDGNPGLGRNLARRVDARTNRVGDVNARHFVVQERSMTRAIQRQNPDQQGQLERSVQLLVALQEVFHFGRVKDGLRQGKIRPSLDLFAQRFDLFVQVLGAHIQGAAHQERRRLSDRIARLIDPGVEVLLDKLDQARRYNIVVVVRFRVIADLRR